MKPCLILIIASSLVGCSSIPHYDEYIEAKRNFRYGKDTYDEWVIYESISDIFYGDCEDFAFTLQNQIGGSVWHVIIMGGPFDYENHAVLKKDGYIYENIERAPIPVERYDALFLKEMSL